MKSMPCTVASQAINSPLLKFVRLDVLCCVFCSAPLPGNAVAAVELSSHLCNDGAQVLHFRARMVKFHLGGLRPTLGLGFPVGWKVPFVVVGVDIKHGKGGEKVAIRELGLNHCTGSFIQQRIRPRHQLVTTWVPSKPLQSPQPTHASRSCPSPSRRCALCGP